MRDQERVRFLTQSQPTTLAVTRNPNVRVQVVAGAAAVEVVAGVEVAVAVGVAVEVGVRAGRPHLRGPQLSRANRSF
jgi:hypothetical protein